MKRGIAATVIGGVILTLIGCHSAPAVSKNDEANMRNNFAKKGFDINDVPPAQRDRVKAIMEAQKNPNGPPK